MIIDEFAPAKVNLSLHVTGQRSDGYHLLDSLVVFAYVGDRLTVSDGPTSLQVTGPFADGVPRDGKNIILKALALLGQEAAVTLEKNLPHPAGIGGGSSDAAAVVRAICKITGQALPVAADLAVLGADVPVCLSPKPQRMSGIGDQLDDVRGLPPLFMVLVNPGLPCPTGAVFNALPNKNNAPMDRVPTHSTFDDFILWLQQQRNDLEAPARQVTPVIANILDALSIDASIARMSGSGATCFGLYPTAKAAQQAAARLAKTGWWVKATDVL